MFIRLVEVMNRSGPILAEVMTGTYERSRAADKGSYEELMNGDFLFAPRKVLSRRSPSLFVPAYAAATLPSSYADLRASSGLARLLQSDRKAKPSASSFQRRESMSQTQ